MTVSLLSFFLATMVTWALLLTRPFHEHITGDHSLGRHKTHRHPALRIGGVPIYFGLIGVTVYLAYFAETGTTDIYAWLTLAGSIVFLAGIAEDITSNVRPRWRLVAAFISAGIFVWLSGYYVTDIDFPIIGMLFENYAIAVFATCFAIAGIANAVNIIDGYHGLASGAVSIMFMTTGLLAYRVGDISLALVCASFVMVILGFFIFNFPLGRIFLGDGGAYFVGFSLAAVIVMLIERNPEISPWSALLVLGYPIVETMISIVRRMLRNGSRAANADNLHLHHLVHRSFARPLARRIGHKVDSNPVAGILMWVFPTVTAVMAQIGLYSIPITIFFFIVFVGTYFLLYLRVSLMRPKKRRKNGKI